MSSKTWMISVLLPTLLAAPVMYSQQNSKPVTVKQLPPAAERQAREKVLERVFDEVRYAHLGADEGLSQGMVSAIVQDHQGYMWFGTKDGLNKYDGHSFTTYRHDPSDSTSISGNRVTALFEDSKNQLWVGTAEHGLNLFHRSEERFERFKHDPAKRNSLSGNSIMKMVEDSSGSLWIGTNRSGLTKLVTDGVRDSADKPLMKSNYRYLRYLKGKPSILDLLVDRQGKLWVTLIDADDWQVYTYLFLQEPDTTWNGETSSSILRIDGGAPYEDAKGIVWIMTTKGVVKLEPSRHEFILHPIPDYSAKNEMNIYKSNGIPIPPWLRSARGSGYRKISGELLWFSSFRGGYYVFDTASQTYAYIETTLYEPGKIQGSIGSIYRDRGGILWFGTNGYGLYKFDSKSNRFTNPVYQTKDRLPEWQKTASIRDHSLRSIRVDPKRDELLWFTSNRARLCRVNRKRGTFTAFFMNQKTIGDNATVGYPSYNFDQDRQGVLWATGEHNELIRIDVENKTEKRLQIREKNAFESIIAVFADKAGYVWSVIEPDILACFDPQLQKTKYYYFNPNPDKKKIATRATAPCFYQDKNDLLWIGTAIGLFCFDPDQEAFVKHYRNDPNNPKSLSYDNIYSIAPDPREPERYLWLGTAGFGVNRFDRETETFKVYTEADGLPNNTVYGILTDDEGNLWMSTNQGLTKFNPQTETFRNYTVEDGLQSNEFNRFSYHKAADGEMFFGGINGLNSFYPEDIRDDPYSPPIAITDFQYYDPIATSESTGWTRLPTPVSYTGRIELPYQKNTVSVEFSALDYSNIRRNQYAYRMEGLNEDWIYCGTDRKANYSSLPPGDYVFRVKGTNSDGIWNEKGTSVKIIIHPPWWRTWWAYTFYGLIILGIFYGLRRYELNRQQLRHGLEIEKVESDKLKELDSLKSRFFANISHEFRTPLTLIMGPINNMLGRLSDQGNQKDLKMMQRNAQRLLRLINQLLDLSKLDAGKLTLEVSRDNIIPFLKGLVFSFESLAARRNIDLHFDTPQDEIMLYFDRDKIEKILINILSNAFKFTPRDGKISVAQPPCCFRPNNGKRHRSRNFR